MTRPCREISDTKVHVDFAGITLCRRDSIRDERVPIGREVKPMVPTTAAFTVPCCKNVHVVVV